MNATERLRALLDERGVRWIGCSKAEIDNQTFCRDHTYTEFQDGLMVTHLTPEQAVEATLGSGLQAENEKLRELVRGLWYCSENESKAMCEGCPLGVVEGNRLALACEKLMYGLGVDA